jgi:TetR/AcrR family transcriptional repressor of lmrAB and yxaGH operons
MSSKRDDIIEATCDLLEAQGYYATGLNQIVSESGAPKGSLYYYFPEGKEELTAEAIERTGRLVSQRIRQGLAQKEDVAEAVRLFVRDIAHHVEASGFRTGGPLMTVAMETATSSQRLNRACRQAYRLLQEAFAQKLAHSGYSEARAAELAAFITASVEGGIILSRTYHSGDPLRQVADELARTLAVAREA